MIIKNFTLLNKSNKKFLHFYSRNWCKNRFYHFFTLKNFKVIYYCSKQNNNFISATQKKLIKELLKFKKNTYPLYTPLQIKNFH